MCCCLLLFLTHHNDAAKIILQSLILLDFFINFVRIPILEADFVVLFFVGHIKFYHFGFKVLTIFFLCPLCLHIIFQSIFVEELIVKIDILQFLLSTQFSQTHMPKNVSIIISNVRTTIKF